MNFETIKINNQSIALYQKGSGDTTLFFVCGNASSMELFNRQFESNLIKKFHLVVIDLPGHGNSAYASNPEKDYTITGFLNIISGVIDHLNLKNIIYIGHSFGGHIILQSLDKLRDVKGLVVFGSTPSGTPPAFEKAFFPHPSTEYIFRADLSDSMFKIWAEALFEPGVEIPEFITVNMRKADPLVRSTIGASISLGLFHDELLLAEKLKVPLAIFHGEHDQLVNPEYLEGLSIAMTWKNKIHYIPDAGHSPQWENPDRFNALLEEYILDVTAN
jgi:pimeloyl-ACP methyl ester carboxylesterase